MKKRLLLPVLAVALPLLGVPGLPVGIVVETVESNSAASAASIKPGDILIEWERPPRLPANPAGAHGTFSTDFDLREVVIEQAPRGPVILSLLRDGRKTLVELRDEDWGIRARPQLSGSQLDKYEQGKALVVGGKLDSGIAIWQELELSATAFGDRLLAAWISLRAANALGEAKSEAATAAADRAVASSDLTGDPFIREQARYEKERILRDLARYAEAMSVAKDALVVLGPTESLAAAQVMRRAGMEARAKGDLKSSEEYGNKALRIRAALAPGSLSLARSYADLGLAAKDRGDYDTADSYLLKALAIQVAIGRDTIDVAHSLHNLSNVARRRNEFAKAQDFALRSLQITERLAPDSNEHAVRLETLGNIADDRGDFTAAETYWLRSVAIMERKSPRRSWSTLLNLGDLALRRGNVQAAEAYFSRALRREEELVPTGNSTAYLLRAMARAAEARGDFKAAENYITRSLDISRKLSPDGPQTAGDLSTLGHLKMTEGDFAEAEKALLEALALRTRILPDGLFVAGTLRDLGELDRRRGNLADAEKRFRQALEICDRLLPGTATQVQLLHDLGRTELQRGQVVASLDHFDAAIRALEYQDMKLGDSQEAKANFRADWVACYADYAEALLLLQRPGDAYAVVEQGRARALLAQMAERDIMTSDIPGDLDARRRHLDADYEHVQDELSRLSPRKDGDKIQELLLQLVTIRRQQAEVAGQIRRASPRYGSLRYPRVLDLAATRESLDPGTLLLSYCVGSEKTFFLAVMAGAERGPRVSVFNVPLGEKALRESVESLRNLIDSGKVSPDLEGRSRALYDALLRPAESLLAKSSRLLILPDGPLHTLPWAALSRSNSGRRQFLVEWKPIHTAVSATAYAEFRRARRSAAASVQIAAFGDPRFPATPARNVATTRGESGEDADELEDAQLRSLLRGGFRFNQLPESRKEVEEIASLYAPKSVAYLGPDATEERAKSISKDVPIIHFATHAIINERFPLDSALVFTIPEHPKEGQDNGLLQAWEIFEQMRIDAGLVTLSACDSGLGKEMGGEGLIGLTRAFQYAGARSVLASLWKVEDKATAELMKRFYTYLKGGKTKDEALRSAQIDLIHSKEYSNPGDWAAFQLNGDWK